MRRQLYLLLLHWLEIGGEVYVELVLATIKFIFTWSWKKTKNWN